MNDLLRDQPEMKFVEELKRPVHEVKTKGFGKRACAVDEIDVSGMYLDVRFAIQPELLETAYADFRRFLEVYGIGGERYPVTVVYGETDCFEQYVLTVASDGATIRAADTEGIRRGLVYLEDQLIAAEAPALRPRCVTRTPVVKTRITRSVYSPTNRPPLNIDELFNDVDYYPDEYLNRIAHDGNNGVWIYTRFAELLTSDVFPEYGSHSAERLEKLRRVVAKCARYGIKVYVFGCEPLGIGGEMAAKHPDVIGVGGWDNMNTICPRTEKGRAYIVGATERLFKAVPDLGGFIAITAGERVTTCQSMDSYIHCPRCSRYSRGENLSYVVGLHQEGMRRAGSNAPFISWTYGFREWDGEDILEYVRTAPDDACLMMNFDEVGYNKQLGRARISIDYWLSYAGPAQMFADAAGEANDHRKRVFAKMQVCNSHELATVPYIPAPGLIFEKYKQAYAYKVEGILQCWYMGSYPSIMSKAAGELSFCTEFDDREAFLEYLAAITYGKSVAKQVANAWELFTRGYQNYPTNIMFSYYGPMHDGVVWDLALLPKNIQQPRSWYFTDDRRGDRISEALQCGHTLEEAITLCEAICTYWEQGVAALPREHVGELNTLADALNVLFHSGTNILHFYSLREQLGYGRGDPHAILEQMRTIVQEEICHSETMIALCEQDNRLGYHSEACAFKYYPGRLTERIQHLEELLATEFPQVEQRLAQGKPPLAYYVAEGMEGYTLTEDKEKAVWSPVADKGAIRLYYDCEKLYLDVQCAENSMVDFSFEYRLLWPSPQMRYRNGTFDVEDWHRIYHGLFGETLEKERAKYRFTKTEDGFSVEIDRRLCDWTENVPLKLAVMIDRQPWVVDPDRRLLLGKHEHSPGSYGWLIP